MAASARQTPSSLSQAYSAPSEAGSSTAATAYTPSISTSASGATAYTPSISTSASASTTPAPIQTTTTTTSSSPSPPSSNSFLFPLHYSWPPFFTLQPNLQSRASQYHSWSLLIQSYCRHAHLFSLSLIDAVHSPLFYNRALARRLSLRDARAVVDWMASKEGGGRAEWIERGAAPAAAAESAGAGLMTAPAAAVTDEGSGGRCWVFWRRPEEWADVIEGWVEETGQKGSVLTLYEIAEGDGSLKEEFHGIEPELLNKSLQVSVKRGKAQIFGQEDRLGIKFF